MRWKIGVSDPWSTELPASLEDVAFKAQKAIGLNLFHLRLPGMHMASSKYPHNAANAVWIKNSRLQNRKTRTYPAHPTYPGGSVRGAGSWAGSSNNMPAWLGLSMHRRAYPADYTRLGR